jgi:hypothetical protein
MNQPLDNEFSNMANNAMNAGTLTPPQIVGQSIWKPGSVSEKKRNGAATTPSTGETKDTKSGRNIAPNQQQNPHVR